MTSLITRKASAFKPGDIVAHMNPRHDYQIDAVEESRIGMVRHRHGEQVNSYWPDELLYSRIAASEVAQ